MTKLEKIDKELSKAREKAAEWQTKIRDLEKQRQEEENSMIVQAVRSLKLTPAELAEFFSNPGITASGQLGPRGETSCGNGLFCCRTLSSDGIRHSGQRRHGPGGGSLSSSFRRGCW